MGHITAKARIFLSICFATFNLRKPFANFLQRQDEMRGLDCQGPQVNQHAELRFVTKLMRLKRETRYLCVKPSKRKQNAMPYVPAL